MRKEDMPNIKQDIPVKEFIAEITSGDLLHLMTHAATREDIAKLDSKIDNVRTEVQADIEKLNYKIDRVSSEIRTEIKSEVSGLRTEFKADIYKVENSISKLETKLDTSLSWITGLIITGLVMSPISAIIVIHFSK